MAVVLACAFLALAGCSQRTAPELPYSVALQRPSVYRLSVGDSVRIDVLGEPQLTGEYTISPQGTIAMALIGEVPAAGLTARELQGMLTERLSQGYLRNPGVTVEMADYRPYYVFGEVAHPGQFAAKVGMTLTAAIANAGGYTKRANRKAVFLRRAGTKRDYRVDPNEALVAPGDVILVPPR